MAKRDPQNTILALLLALSLVAPAWILAGRHVAEKENTTVELVVDYSEVEQLAVAVRISPVKALQRLKAAGATGVALQEETFADLLDSGQAALVPSTAAIGTTVIQLSAGVRGRICQRLLRLGYIPTVLGRGVARGSQVPTIPVQTSAWHLRNLPMGLAPDGLDAARKARMDVVARLLNYPGVNARAIEAVTQDLRREGISTVIFGQEQVLGFRGLIAATADSFRRHGFTYGSIEFAKQKGDDKLSRLVGGYILRVHSIPAAEMATVDRRTAIERYTLAARERNVRLCYLRLFDTAAPDPIGANADYIATIASRLKAAGFTLGKAAPITASELPRVLLPLLGLPIALGCMFLLTSVLRLPWRQTLALTVLACICAAAISASGGVVGRKALALLAAIIFPTAAAIRAGSDSPASTKSAGFWPSAAHATGRLFCATGITVAGASAAAALLSERMFMVKVDQFAGVKLAHVAPMLLVLFAYAGGVAWKSADWAEQKAKAAANIKRLASQPMLVWQMAACIVVLVMLGIAVARSGNDSGVGVSQVELKFRAVLDRILLVRPRTKEFLVGHPILFLGVAAAAVGRRRWAAPLIIFGAIGQVSVFNTFCHVHTPILASLIRVISGAVLGAALGLALYAILRPWILAEKQMDVANPTTTGARDGSQ